MTDYETGEFAYPLAGHIYYRPRNAERGGAATPRLPTPHIRPRARRPQSIHIVSYPPGYVPPDLRPCGPVRNRRRRSLSERITRKACDTQDGISSTRRVFEKVLAPIKSHFSHYVAKETHKLPKSPSAPEIRRRSTSSWRETISRPQSTITIPVGGRSSVASTMMDARGGTLLGTGLQNVPSNSLIAPQLVKNNISSAVTELSKPVASGSGVTCSIILAEPNVFLTGFEHDGNPRHETANSSALLRGKLQLKVTKNVKLKSVALKLSGKARTEWPEGIPPLKVEQYEEDSLRTQVLTFFHSMHEAWETDYGNQCVFDLKQGVDESTSPWRLGGTPNHSQLSLSIRSRPAANSNSYKRLSLRTVDQRSFGKGEWPAGQTSSLIGQLPLRAYKVFYPGTYEYSFELPIDHHQLETAKLQYGSVKWELEAVVERAGAFKPNLHGTKEVCIVRVPDQLSLEMTEPISISRQWEDQLHYDIMISGKSFPIGTKIPIAFKLTPLAKVQVHKLKVFVTETVEYWTGDRRVTRKDPGRKILLLEKTAGKAMDKQYDASDIRVLAGGELSPEQRHEARIAAARRRSALATMAHTTPQPLPEPADNLLGDLDLGLESYWGSTEIEMNVQIPTCEQMNKDKNLRLHPDCSWKNVNVYHWIKIVMRISRIDPDDPAGKRRRHFEISIDSPFTVLDCRATQANTSLPRYSGAEQPIQRQQASCGCPDASVIATNPSSSSTSVITPSAGPVPVPPAAHIGWQATAGDPRATQRPIHLMRYPSFAPPDFDADQPPPALVTPPPQYDSIVGTPSVDGLADYFARLADYDEGDSDSGEDEVDLRSPSIRIMDRNGRVNVVNPRTPGSRMPSRSVEIPRSTIPVTLDMASALRYRRD